MTTKTDTITRDELDKQTRDITLNALQPIARFLIDHLGNVQFYHTSIPHLEVIQTDETISAVVIMQFPAMYAKGPNDESRSEVGIYLVYEDGPHRWPMKWRIYRRQDLRLPHYEHVAEYDVRMGDLITPDYVQKAVIEAISPMLVVPLQATIRQNNP